MSTNSMGQLSTKEFCPIRIEDVLPNQVVGFDIFIFLPMNHKYVRYIVSDQPISEAKLKRLKFRHINQLFINRHDSSKYYSHLSQSIVGSITKASDEEKSEVVRRAAKSLFASIDAISSDEDARAWANNCMEVSQTILADLVGQEITVVFEKLQNLLGNAESLVDHSTAVSSLSVILAMALGYHDSRTLSELAFGGLVHDIGLARQEADMVERYLLGKELSEEEVAEFKKHPHEGVKILGGVSRSKSITDKVLRIVVEHHENVAGTGFPQGLTGTRIFLLAKIVAIADRLALDIMNSKSVDVKVSLLNLSREQEVNRTLDTQVLSQILKVIR